MGVGFSGVQSDDKHSGHGGHSDSGGHSGGSGGSHDSHSADSHAAESHAGGSHAAESHAGGSHEEGRDVLYVAGICPGFKFLSPLLGAQADIDACKAQELLT